MALANGCDKDIVEAIVVVIADGDAQSEKRNAKSRFCRDVGKCAVVAVVVKLRCCRRALRVTRPVLPVDEQNVWPSVVVVIEERNTRAHCFRQPLLSKRAVVVDKVDAGLSGDVTESDRLRARSQTEKQND